MYFRNEKISNHHSGCETIERKIKTSLLVDTPKNVVQFG
jgi:hypothetical protein